MKKGMPSQKDFVNGRDVRNHRISNYDRPVKDTGEIYKGLLQRKEISQQSFNRYMVNLTGDKY